MDTHMKPAALELALEELTALRKEIESLRQQLETERMRLVACGVVALANTPESAKQAREMHPDYWSASLKDVMRAVDAEMELHKQLSIINAAYEKSVEQHNKTLDELAAALAACELQREALLDTVAHLSAAASAYEKFVGRHGTRGHPDALFLTRYADFIAAEKRGRDVLAVQPDASALKQHDEALIEWCICVVYHNTVLTIEQKDKIAAVIRELKGTL